jgi:hypothetical protein
LPRTSSRRTTHLRPLLSGRFSQLNKLPQETPGQRSEPQPASETEKLIALTEGSQDNLFTAKTVFPFVLFTHTLKIDRQKLTIVHNSFFRMSQTASTELKNIMNIQTELGPLFGSITITSKHFLNNTQTIKFLKRKDIATAQRLLQGFMIANRAKINTDGIEKLQLMALLDDLGQENRR